MSRGPVVDAYADVIDHPCPNCRVGEGDFCVHADGTLRRIPCVSRLSPIDRAGVRGSTGESEAKEGHQ